MLNMLRKRLDRDDEGFTLIELMVVVLIIAILIAIAIPTFLGARSRAQDRAAQSDIRNALTAEKVFYTDNQSYTTDATTLNGIEPSLTFTASNNMSSANDTSVYVHVAGGIVYLGKKSKSGQCFLLRDNPAAGGGTQYAKPSSCPSDVTSASYGASW